MVMARDRWPISFEAVRMSTPLKDVCRVVDAFVARLDMVGLGFERAEAAETGRPGSDPASAKAICTVICGSSVPRGGWSRSTSLMHLNA